MPIRPPSLDDRSFDDLVQELVARIPAHTPEWTNPQLGDPGRTLIDLFAWLGDTLLYRVNLIPERRRLAFLRLLGEQMRPAIPASGVVQIQYSNDDISAAKTLQAFASIPDPVPFETLSEITVLPVAGEAYYKRAITKAEAASLANVLDGLDRILHLNGAGKPYVTTPVFAGGQPLSAGFDLISAVDKSLWIALLAAKPDAAFKDEVTKSLQSGADGRPQLISVGVLPLIEVPALFEDIGPRGRIPHEWLITTGSSDPAVAPVYLRCEPVADSSGGLIRRGVERLALPGVIGVPVNDVRGNVKAGVGDLPPRLDDPEKANRLIAWLRLRPAVRMDKLALSWVGINAVEIDQRQTVVNRVAGQSDGSADQRMQLPGTSVEASTLVVQVEEAGRGFQHWPRVDDLALAGGARAYSLDSEAGVIQFGDGVNAIIPEAGRRVNIARMRAGGGKAGNVPPGSLASISAKDLASTKAANLKVVQMLAATGGDDAETLDAAERRIPALIRHRDRAVTEDDYRRLAAETPGVLLGRVEVLARFKPQQRRSGVPGVVSVMALPSKAATVPPNPRPDRPLLEAVHAYLSVRCPVTTELYVIGCEYVPLSVTVGVTIEDGYGREGVLAAVTDAIRKYLWPLPPGGSDGAGWKLRRPVKDREIEVAVARVAGVDSVLSLRLFKLNGKQWIPAGAEIALDLWQLPELLQVLVVADQDAPAKLDPQSAFGDDQGIGVPVVPEVC